jgi:hypothetical protein
MDVFDEAMLTWRVVEGSWLSFENFGGVELLSAYREEGGCLPARNLDFENLKLPATLPAIIHPTAKSRPINRD